MSVSTGMINRMNRQSRASRWLRAIEQSRNVMAGAVQSFSFHSANGSSLPKDGQVLLIAMGSDPINLIAEADPPIPGTALASQLKSVIESAKKLEVGENFTNQAATLVESIDAVLPTLRATVIDEVDSISDIVDELERAFLISLMLSMTAHNVLLTKVSDWEQKHQQHLTKPNRRDVGHYFSLKSMEPVDTTGQGVVHMQHLISAINSGAELMIFGDNRARSTTYYPEAQSIQYGQWFSYIHAIWDEQFRDRIARFWSGQEGVGTRYEKNDIRNDFFGDIRLVRNDFVHNKGEARESLNTKVLRWEFQSGQPMQIQVEDMYSLIENFPRSALLEPPIGTATTRQARSNIPGSADVNLLEQFREIVSRRQLNKNKAMDEMLSDWIGKNLIEGVTNR